MSFASWLKSMKARANRVSSRRRTFAPSLESLEDRLAPAAVLTVNSILDTNVRDASLTFREALLVNNRTLAVASLSAAEQAQVTGTPSATDADTIKFNIGAGGVQTIAPTSALPLITDSVTIDGTTQPGFVGSSIIELNGAGAGSANGLFIVAGNSTVRGLAINRFIGNGIEIQGNGNNRIEGCFLGTDVTGTLDRGNTGRGVNISGTADNVIGGTAPGAGNVISGNDFEGIKVIFSQRNQILGNRVGTNAAGIGVVPNGAEGILFNSASNNSVGGTTAAARNIVSGNTTGIHLLGTSPNNVVIGNYVGTDVTGTVDLGNRSYGVALETLGVNGTRIGGATPEERNVISGNDLNGVFVNSHGNSVLGNYIGTDVTGTAPLGNSGAGVRHNFGLNTLVIGNVISANAADGVSFNGQYTGSRVQGNHIGTDAAGTADLGNRTWGVSVGAAAPTDTDLRIGGMAAGEGNVIAYNDRAGVAVQHQDARGVAILGNSIFANDGIPVGSGLGIDLFVEGVTPNDVGDADTKANLQQNFPELTAATISGSGTTITGKLNSTANTVFRIEFFSNVAADPTGFGEGQTYLGFTEVTTDASGNVPGVGNTFTVTLGPVSAGHFVTATATRLIDHDANQDTSMVPRETSEFSQARIVVQANQAPVANDDAYSVSEDGTLTQPGPGVLGNDTDADGNPLTAILVTGTSHGSLTLNANGSFAYTPAADYFGPDSFTYKANDGTADSNVATVSISVNLVNDAPTASNGSLSTAEDTATTGALVATDIDSAAWTYSVVDASAAHGTVTITNASTGAYSYSPNADYNGPASFTFKANDGALDGNVATVSITVTPVNDAPMASNGNLSTAEGTEVPGTLVATDIDSVALTYSVADASNAHGTVIITDVTTGAYSYTPDADYNGPASFTFKANDGAVDSNVATVTIQVLNLVDVSGRVFNEEDNDGVYEPGDGEIGIGGVTVQLFDQTSATLIATQTTAADGSFSFDVNLAAGTYMIVAAQPAGFLDGRESAGNIGGSVDNSHDSNQISAISVGDPGTTNDAVDYLFADIRPSQAQGLVWHDSDNDGHVDFGEAAIAGAVVELTGMDDRGNAVNRSVTSDTNGIYAFIDLRPSNAAGYTIHEMQPAGYLDGIDSLGTVNGVTVGNASVNDTFSEVVLPRPGSVAENYNFGERPLSEEGVTAGQTATIGFWQNKNGQNLIKSLNGGSTSTQLGDWLAANFTNMYGAGAGTNNLTGKTNAQVAAFYKTLFARTAHTAAGGGAPKMDAQVMATALAVYVTNQTLAGTAAASYGFLVTVNGVGARTFNVGNNGAAFGVAISSNVTVLDLLLAVNSRSRNGLLYDLDGDGDANDALETSYRNMANNVFSAINEAGDI